MCALPVYAQDGGTTYTLLEPSVVGGQASMNASDYFSNIYTVAIASAGVLAVLMFAIGGIQYMFSGAGGAKSNGRTKMVNAVFGIILALAAWLILNTINPDLVNLGMTLPDATVRGVVAETEGTGGSTPGSAPQPGDPGAQGTGQSTTPATPGTVTRGACTGTNAGCCKASSACIDCKDCVNFSNGYGALCYRGAAGNTGCKLNADLARLLNGANLSAVGAQVSEAWPPTVYHSSYCHRDGTCADVRCVKGCANASVAEVKRVYDALLAAGLSPVFETYQGQCAPYTAAGVQCASYKSMTSPSFHVNM
ncbi:MAG: hypothetical protein HGA67_01725 [Candidatus Yonathbacteria bacterium]|nr:hypothetical protein [Candidatus Yonathbacteria bacterium]